MSAEFQKGEEVVWRTYYGHDEPAIVRGTAKNGRVVITMKEKPKYNRAVAIRQVKPETLRKA